MQMLPGEGELCCIQDLQMYKCLIKYITSKQILRRKIWKKTSRWTVQISPRYAQKYPASNLYSLIKAAYRLYIFRISRFDNRKYFKIDKRVCLREICVEIDHFPIQPFHCCTALPQSSPSNKNLFFVLTLSKYRKWPSFLYARPKSNNFLPTFCFLIPLEKGFHSKSKNKKQKRGSKFVFCRL